MASDALAAAVIVLAIDLVYHFAPNRPQRWPWVTVGSVTATGLWILSSIVFRLYITQMGTYNVTYGAIGGVIVVLLMDVHVESGDSDRRRAEQRDGPKP